MQEEYDITIGKAVGVTRGASTFPDLKSFRESVAIPYINILVENIENRFAEEGVKLLMAASIFNPAQLPDASDPFFSAYGREEIKLLANFYGQEIEVEFNGRMFKSPPVLMLISLFQNGQCFVEHYEKRKKH